MIEPKYGPSDAVTVKDETIEQMWKHTNTNKLSNVRTKSQHKWTNEIKHSFSWCNWIMWMSIEIMGKKPTGKHCNSFT